MTWRWGERNKNRPSHLSELVGFLTEIACYAVITATAAAMWFEHFVSCRKHQNEKVVSPAKR